MAVVAGNLPEPGTSAPRVREILVRRLGALGRDTRMWSTYVPLTLIITHSERDIRDWRVEARSELEAAITLFDHVIITALKEGEKQTVAGPYHEVEYYIDNCKTSLLALIQHTKSQKLLSHWQPKRWALTTRPSYCAQSGRLCCGRL